MLTKILAYLTGDLKLPNKDYIENRFEDYRDSWWIVEDSRKDSLYRVYVPYNEWLTKTLKN